MVNVEFAVAVISIGFLVGVTAVMGYLAFTGPTRDEYTTSDGDSSGAD